MATVERLVELVSVQVLVAVGVVILGVIVGYLAGRVNRQLLERAGVPDAVEGTAFERTMRGLGTSTVAVIAQLSMWFIIGVTALAALSVADVNYTQRFLTGVSSFLPTLFVAALVLIVGIVVGDKVELIISERLRGIKLPQVGILPWIAKYSVVYIATLIALGQVGVATDALIVLLGVYAFAVVVFAAIALWDLLQSGAAGMYLLLTQPYAIGDEVRIDGDRGIVQEVNVFVTRIEAEGEEHVFPNSRVFRQGVVLLRRE